MKDIRQRSISLPEIMSRRNIFCLALGGSCRKCPKSSVYFPTRTLKKSVVLLSCAMFWRLSTNILNSLSRPWTVIRISIWITLGKELIPSFWQAWFSSNHLSPKGTLTCASGVFETGRWKRERCVCWFEYELHCCFQNEIKKAHKTKISDLMPSCLPVDDEIVRS